MTSRTTLAAGPLRCDIEPEVGGCIAGLWFNDLPVMRSTLERPANARAAASYPLVPFSNRIGNANLVWNGTSHPLVRNFGTEPHAIHGVGWQRPWTVLEAEGNSAMLCYEHKPDTSWPFAFDTSQTFRLSADSLVMALSITNQSRSATPVGLGWHPYFVKRADAHVSFRATGRWEMDAVKLPTRRLPHAGLDADCATLDVDHCFDGWSGELRLHDGQLRTHISSKLSRLVVFTNPQQAAIAIEPVSHVNNALSLLERRVATAEELGVAVLQPGESLSAEMTVQVSRAP